MIEAARFDRHLVDTIAILAEHAGDRGRVEHRDGVTITAVGHGGPPFNTAWVTAAPTSPAETIGWTCEVLAGRGLPFMVQVAEEFVASVAGPLEEAGQVDVHVTPGMVRTATAEVPSVAPGLRIVRVTDAEELRRHAIAGAIGFGAPDPEAEVAVFPPSLLDDERVVFFNGYADDDDTPTATGVCAMAGGVAGVYAITVQPSARRRGFGEAMTWAAVVEGARAGTDLVVLQASEMGRPVYERMGFTTVRRHHRFAPRPPA